MKLDWHRVILYITILGMEGCALYILMNLINVHAIDESLFIPGLLLIYPASFGVNLLIRRIRRHIIWLQILSWSICAGAIQLMVKIQLFSGSSITDTSSLYAISEAMSQVPSSFETPLLILFGGILLWWLGLRLAYLKINFAILISEFQFVLIGLLLILLITTQLKVSLPNAVPTMIAFFVFALLGMSITHAREGTSWLSGLHRKHWSGLLIFSIILIIGIGLLISVIVTPGFLQVFLDGLKWLWEQILKFIAFLASLLPESDPGELPATEPFLPDNDPSEREELLPMPEELRNVLRIGWMVLIMTIIFIALWRISSQIFSWLRRRWAKMAGAEVEQLPGTFRIDFFNWLKQLFLKLFRIRIPTPSATKARKSLADIPPVRQIYCHLLNWAAAAGFPRQTNQTPDEFLITLKALIPDAEGDLNFVTRQYVMARYGTYSPTESDLYQLKNCWQKIQQNRLNKLNK